MPEDNSESTEQPDGGNSNPPEETAAIEGIPVPPELLAKMPAEAQRELVMFLSHQRIGFPPNPIASKITPDHITKLIDNSESESQRDFHSQWFTFGYAILALAFLVFVFIYLPSVDKTLFVDVLKLLLTFLGGLGAGFGIAKYKGREK